MDKNAWSVFEQRKALARLRASLMDEVSKLAAGAQGWIYAGFTQSLRVSA